MATPDFFAPPDSACPQVNSETFFLYDSPDAPCPGIEIRQTGTDRIEACNPSRRTVIFRAVDGIVFPRKQPPKRCDVLLHTENRNMLAFIEIKQKQHKGWLSEAIAQIRRTIDEFRTVHPDVYQSARRRTAYAVNPKHGFSPACADTIRDFHRTTGAILRISPPVRIP